MTESQMKVVRPRERVEKPGAFHDSPFSTNWSPGDLGNGVVRMVVCGVTGFSL